MLDIIRNLVSSIFGKILLAVMVLSFALWGVGDILTSGNSQLAAKVGSEKITLDEFYNEFQNQVRNYNESTGSNLSLKEAYDSQLHNILLNELIYMKMINSYARSNDIYLNEESLKLIIKDLPQFKNNDGFFSNVIYKNYIINNFPSEEIFLKQIENIIYQGIIFENLNINSYISNSIINNLYQFEAEKRSINYFFLNNNIVEINTTTSQIDEYYENNKNKYEVDKRIIIDYIEIDLKNYTKLENITNEQISDYYNLNLNQYSKPESRDIQFARFSNKSDALEFYGVYKKNNETQLNEYIALNNINLNKINNFSGDTFPKHIIDNIFNLEKNKITEPIEYDDIGFFVFKVLEINESLITDLDTVKDKIRNDLAVEEAFLDFDDAINYADEMLLNDYSFSDIYENLPKSKIHKSIDLIDFISVSKNENISALEDYTIGYISEIFINDNTAYIFKVTDRINAYVPELNEIIKKVTLDYTENELQVQLDAAAEKIISNELVNVSKFDEYAQQNNLEIITDKSINRSSLDYEIETIEIIFDVKVGDIFKIKSVEGGIGIGYLNEITSPNTSDEQYISIKNNINNNFNSSLETIMGNEIINRTNYEIYNQNIDLLFM